MHKLIIILVCSFLSSTSIAQNWKPLVINDKYNYQIDTLDYPSRTLWIDSVAINGSDSVFYLNRGVRCFDNNNQEMACDVSPFATLQDFFPLSYFDYRGDYMIANNAHFLQKELLQTANGIYILQNPDTFIIHTQDTLNSNWLFNPSRTIIATLARLDTQTIFGSLDSVQILSLSNGDSAVLSKQFGLIYFPNLDNGTSWNLVGIEGRGLGIQIPKFNDFYGQWSVGDSFQYEYGSYMQGQHSSFQQRVSQKNIIQDTVQYQFLQYGIWLGNSLGFSIPQTITVSYYNLPRHPTNHYHEEFVPARAFCGQDTQLYTNTQSFNNPVQMVQVAKENGVWVKYTTSPFDKLPNNDTLFKITEVYGFVTKYVVSLGMVGQGCLYFEDVYLDYLTAYRVHQPDSTLHWGNFEYWWGVATNYLDASQTAWKLVQNPIQNHDIQLVITENTNSETQLKIHNLQGELLHQQIFPIGQTAINVSLSAIPAGLYLATLANGQQYQVIKIVVP